MAVAWADDGTVADAAPVPLVTTLFSAGSDDAGKLRRVGQGERPLDAASGTVFLKDTPALQRIEIVDASGAVVATVRAGELGAAAADPLQAAAVTVDGFHAEFPWVAVLGQADAGVLPTAIRETVSGLVQPSEDHMSMFRECFTLMSEAEKLSVLTIGVATLPDQGRTVMADGQHCKVVFGKTVGFHVRYQRRLQRSDGERVRRQQQEAPLRLHLPPRGGAHLHQPRRGGQHHRRLARRGAEDCAAGRCRLQPLGGAGNAVHDHAGLGGRRDRPHRGEGLRRPPDQRLHGGLGWLRDRLRLGEGGR